MTNSILVKGNLEIIKAKLPGVYSQIEGKTANGNYLVCEAKEPGLYYLAYNEGDKNIPLYSKYNPRQEAEAWAASQDLTGCKHVVMFGLGLGYHVEALLRINPALTFFIYEPDGNLFLKTLEFRNWSIFNWKSIRYFTIEDGSGKYKSFIAQIIKSAKEGWTFLTIPSFERCFPKQVEAFKNSLKEQRKEYIGCLSDAIWLQKEWTINAMKNLPFILKGDSIFNYKSYFKDKNVVMTASGPSLNKAIPYLKVIKEERRALIVAVGTSINGLLKNDLVPDMFISYDPFDLNYQALLPCLDKGVPFIFGSTIASKVLENHIGSKAYCILSRDSVFDHLIGGLAQEEVIRDAPSIAVVTLQLLDKLGVGKVILAGQDLAFYQDYVYADGISVLRPDSKAFEKDKVGYCQVEANNGEKVFTMENFIKMKGQLEIIIKQAKIDNIINTAEYGVKIEGTKFMTWEQVIEDLPAESFSKRVEFSQPKSGGSLKKVKKNVKKIIEAFDKDFNKVEEAVNKFLEAFDKTEIESLTVIFDNISIPLQKLTSTKEFKALIYPMIQNEDHFLRKELTDIPVMNIEQKKAFVQRELASYTNGIKLGIIKLKEAVNGWE